MKMKNSELQDYLSTYPDDADVSYLLANPRKRKLYECVNVFGVMDAPNPIFCIDVGEAKDMDGEKSLITSELVGKMYRRYR